MAIILDFVTLDVFTSTPYKGNPLAVVHLPSPTVAIVTQEQKQAIAREFNFSETVFVHDWASTEELGDQARRIDIFMVDKELPFAGHPTIGSAYYLKAQGVTRLVTSAGPIPIQFGSDEIVSASIPHSTHLNSRRLQDFESSLNTSASHVVAEIRDAELRAPIFCIVRGMTFALIRLASLKHLGHSQITPGRYPIQAKDIMDAGWGNTSTGRYYNVLVETSVEGETRIVKLRTRMVEATIEDPATGSAACALTSYLALYEFQEKQFKFELTQGVEMGRQSEIMVEVQVAAGADGERTIDKVLLGGTACEITRGQIILPPA
ncbi:phenazine biosynthesis PhzC/PhzF protein [Colletotrichum fioriniae PJ7]|uniref:Phenazine biosynthesis PhzC/PhzF protein n=1 Tax=Colletotrichum fioriniae PJ7 TaxID=1445577 RepID=A0A010Q7U3_9PEZI|nr:phenazine biosynthesis PhzC/PhzF protein [Colletotrichum fioriniae PJ7]